MSDTNDTDDKTLSASGSSGKTLSLKPRQGQVRQNFSHGRSKSVVVETKRKRTLTVKIPGTAAPKAEAKKPAPAEQAPKPKVFTPKAPAKQAVNRSGMVLPTLSDHEKEARANALANAKLRESADRVRKQEDDIKRAEEDTKLKVEHEAAEARQAEEEARLKTEEQSRQKAEEEASRRLPQEEVPAVSTSASTERRPSQSKPDRAAGGAPDRSASRQKDQQKPSPSRRGDPRNRRRKLTVTSAYNAGEERMRSMAAMRRQREREKRAMRGDPEPRQKVQREITIPEALTVGELANRMAERGADVVKELMKLDIMATVTETIDADTAQLVVEAMGHSFKRVSASDVEQGLIGEEDDPKDLKPRSPVVTVMGHVDHGKTSLLDALRKENVASGEAGGITQHIGAYQVTLDSGAVITFIDTPGHAAFTAMRARGAGVTDIVVLVVAADDGVMPQTIEAIHHAKAAGVPIIVAINKIDTKGSDPNRVRTELLQHEIVVEGMSGDVLDVEVSALKGTNLDKLLEAINLQTELLELTANPDRMAEGTVIEAKLDKGRGVVGTLLVQRGTLKQGDIVVAGAQWGKVRAMTDEHQTRIDEAGPSMPVEILGLSDTPDAGDDFSVVSTEARAREITEYRQSKNRDAQSTPAIRTLDQIMAQKTEGERQVVAIVVKTDVQGSLEAITGALEKLSTDEVSVKIIHGGVGGITESDITLAGASNAPVIGFNVRANKQARDLASAEKTEIRYYSVIYNLVDDVKAAMEGLLSPELRETFLGNAEILEVFNISKIGKIGGCRITEGVARRDANVRLIRDNVVIHEGSLKTLKRFKDEVKEVQGGQECGMAFENYHDIQAGDVIEIFEVEEIARKLEG